jgi:hypothetical protein
MSAYNSDPFDMNFGHFVADADLLRLFTSNWLRVLIAETVLN